MKQREYVVVYENKAKLNKMYIDLVENKQLSSTSIDHLSSWEQKMKYMRKSVTP